MLKFVSKKYQEYDHYFFTLALEITIPQQHMEHTPNSKNTLIHLISEYEALAQKGDITKLEEKSLLKLIHFFESEYQKDKAMEVVEHALDLYPFSVEFYIKKADILLNSKYSDEAKIVLDKAENFAPGDLHIQLLRCKLYAQAGQFETSFALLNELLEKKSGSEFTFIKLMESHILELFKDYKGSFKVLREILFFAPNCKEALERVWVAAELCKAYDDSIVLHNALIDHDPYNFQAWYNLAQAYSSTGEYDYAIDAFEYAFIINPEFESAYKECADLCFEIGKHQKALKIYMETMEVFGSDLDLLYNIGQCLLSLGNSKSARKYLNKALKLDPYNDEIHYSIGISFAREARWINAINAYKRALDLDDMREEYFAGLGEAFFNLNEFERAEYYYKKAIKYGPEQSFIWLSYANFLMATNKLDRAIKILESAEFYTQAIDLEYCKTACLFLLDKKQEGIKALEEVLQKDYELHALLFHFAPHLQFDKDIQSILNYYK